MYKYEIQVTITNIKNAILQICWINSIKYNKGKKFNFYLQKEKKERENSKL